MRHLIVRKPLVLWAFFWVMTPLSVVSLSPDVEASADMAPVPGRFDAEVTGLVIKEETAMNGVNGAISGTVVRATAAGSTSLRELTSTVTATAAICGLPAVATLDWCDRAAAALCDLYRPSVCCVLIATVEPSGRIAELEAAGVSASTEETTTAPGGAHGRATPIGWREQVSDTSMSRASSIDEMRCRAERLASVGFCPGESINAEVLCAPISQLPNGWGWRNTPMGPMWAWTGASEVLVGMGRLGTSVAGRSVVVYVAPSSKDGEQTMLRLQSAMPLLMKKALAAIGPQRSSRARWISEREQHVLEQLILGKSVRQIAEEFARSPHTVHDHVKALHRKLNASSRGELIARALGYITEASRIRHTSKPIGIDIGAGAANGMNGTVNGGGVGAGVDGGMNGSVSAAMASNGHANGHAVAVQSAGTQGVGAHGVGAHGFGHAMPRTEAPMLAEPKPSAMNPATATND
jgi:DNA-binding CsgD family transcriptional regulator